MPPKSHFRKGQIAVVMMLLMLPLLSLIGLGADLGLLYFHWVLVQKAADAAVLAGAGYLPNHTSEAQTPLPPTTCRSP